MSWLEKIITPNKEKAVRHNIPEGVWTKCESCEQVVYRAELERNLNVCPKCGFHQKIAARERIIRFLDDNGGLQEIGENLEPKDILKFKDTKRYKDRISAAQKTTNEKDALVVIKGKLKGLPVVCAAFEFSFMGGSMGSVVGARFVKAARMQESLFSLMQMAKTSAALQKLSEAGIPFISVLTNPTMGGVSASLAMLGDVNVAEPKALIGFAGPRVIEQTVREKLPEGFQRSEFLLQKGAIDMIVDRREMRDRLANVISILMKTDANDDRNVKVVNQ